MCLADLTEECLTVSPISLIAENKLKFIKDARISVLGCLVFKAKNTCTIYFVN